MAGTGAKYIPVEDVNRRGPDYGKPNFRAFLQTLFALFVKPKSFFYALLNNIQWIGCSSSNYNTGRLGYGVNGVIIHTVVGTMTACDGTFQNPTRQASAHYCVADDGSVIHQYVNENDTAWHCGRYYPDSSNPLANVNTIGIEHGDNGAPYSPRPDALYVTSAALVRDICTRYGIPMDRTHIRKHLEVSVAITTCPDTLDIDRIVAMANGTWGPRPNTLTGDDQDMLYIGPVHSLGGTKTFTVFAAGTARRERTTQSPATGSLAVGASVTVDSYCYSTGPEQSTDLDGHGTAGPDYLWWHSTSGQWVPDAILSTTPVWAAAPGPAIPATEALDHIFATQAQLQGLGPDDDSAYATKADVTTVANAAVAAAPIKPHKHDVSVTDTHTLAGATTDTI